jgi:hypothetical protein
MGRDQRFEARLCVFFVADPNDIYNITQIRDVSVWSAFANRQ